MYIEDGNGRLLADGDSVTSVRNFKIYRTSLTLKRGAPSNNIRLTNDLQEIECNAEKIRGTS